MSSNAAAEPTRGSRDCDMSSNGLRQYELPCLPPRPRSCPCSVLALGSSSGLVSSSTVDSSLKEPGA